MSGHKDQNNNEDFGLDNDKCNVIEPIKNISSIAAGLSDVPEYNNNNVDSLLDDFEKITVSAGASNNESQTGLIKLLEPKPIELSTPIHSPQSDNINENIDVGVSIPIDNLVSINVKETNDVQLCIPVENLNSNVKIRNTPSKILKVLTIGDPHFKVSNTRETDEMTTKICDLAKDIQPDFIVCLGDILDRHETIHVSPLMRATYFLKSLSDIAPLYAVIGNHDRPNNSNFLTNEHPFNSLKLWKNTTVVDKVIENTVDNYRFVFVPYVPPGRFNEALETIENPLQNTTAIFSHQEYKGAKMGAIVSEIGDEWPLENPLVISGHIHDFDELQSNLFYVGTPIQHAFGDKSDKTVSLYTFYPDKHFQHERIDLGLMKKEIVYLKPEQVPTYEPPENSMIKVVIRGTSSEIKAVMKLTKIKELQKKGVKVSYKHLGDDTVEDNPDQAETYRHMRYLERLHHEISNDHSQLKWFEKLFGKINQTVIV